MARYSLSLLFLYCFSVLAQESSDSAIVWDNVFQYESVNNLSGGVERGSRYNFNNSFNAEVNTANAGWWHGGKWHIQILAIDSNIPSELTGEYQVLSNLEADRNILVYQFWYEHLLSETNHLLFGLHDYNSTFYSLDSAHLFFNASFGIGPDTSQLPPSIFPVTSLALHLTTHWDDNYLLVAVYDGIAGDPQHPRDTHIRWGERDGFLYAAEYGKFVEGEFKWGIGCWYRTTEVENPISGLPSDQNSGCYGIGERHFSERLSVFFQLGRADGKQNQVETYLGAGVTLSDVLKNEDAAGLSVASAHNGNSYRKANPDILAAETIWESTYLYPLHKAVSLQASLFYLQHPSMNPELENAVALSLRAIITF